MIELKIATVGDNCIDRLAAPLAVSLVGGNALNVAVQLRSLGSPVTYFGAIGNDPEGDRTLAILKKMDVDTAHVRVVEGVTAYTEISVDEAGDRRMDFEEFGVCSGYFPDECEIEKLLRMRHVHLGWIDDGGRLRRLLTEANVSVSQDVSVNADPEICRSKGWPSPSLQRGVAWRRPSPWPTICWRAEPVLRSLRAELSAASQRAPANMPRPE